MGSQLNNRSTSLASSLAAPALRFVNEDVDARILAVFRVVYSLIGLVLVAQMLRESDFLWLRSDPHHATGTGLLSLTAVLVLALGLGVGGRVVRIAHFASISYLASILPITCIDYSLYMMAALWTCWLDLNVAWSLDGILSRRFSGYPKVFRPPGRALAWPIFLQGCNLGLLIFSAGILKHLDPQWRTGYGLYFTFLLPWIKAPWLAGILVYRQAFRVMNYAVVVLEYSVLPLFLWRRTRPVSVALTAVFFSGLIFPFRIDPIGYVGLTHCICLAALARNSLTKRTHEDLVPKSTSRSVLSASMLVGSSAFLVLMFAVLHYREFHGRLTNVGGDRVYVRWPLKISPVAEAAEPPSGAPLGSVAASTNAPSVPSTSALRRGLGIIEGAVTTVNRYSTRLQVNHVFSIADSRGNYLYRALLTLDDGTTREPFRVFREDMRPGPYSSGVLVPRFIQGSMYPVTFAVDEITYNHRVPDDEGRSLMERIIQFSRSMLTDSERARVVTSQVLVRPILMPQVYEGEVEPWSASSWSVLYSAEKPPAAGQFHMDVARYPLSYPVNDGWRVTIAP